MITYKEPNVKFHFEWLEEATIIDIKKKTLENINETKMDTRLKKIAVNHPNVQVMFEVKIKTKNDYIIEFLQWHILEIKMI